MSNPLLLLHGAIGCKEQFDDIWALLSEEVDVYALDFEGHGEAGKSARPFVMENFRENVIAFLDERGIETADIFGHSMGGYVGLYLALTAPERVGKVFTLGTKFAWSPEVAAREVKNMDPDRMLEKVPQFAAVLEARHEDWRDNLAKSREMTLALGENPPLTAETLAGIDRPVRIGLGDKDRMVALEEAVGMFRALPNAELQVLPRTGHPLERVDVERVTAAMRDFFGE